MTSAELARRAGVSYRRIDYWTREGYLRPMSGDQAPGSGNRREWSREEVVVARFLSRIAPYSVDRPNAAGEGLTTARVRQLCARVRRGDLGEVRLGRGIYLDLAEAST